MKLTQVHQGDRLVAAIVEGDKYRLIPGQTTASLIVQAEISGKPLATIAAALAVNKLIDAEAGIPITPPEVWGAGCTYAPSAEFRDTQVGQIMTPEHTALLVAGRRQCIDRQDLRALLEEQDMAIRPRPRHGVVIGRCPSTARVVQRDSEPFAAKAVANQ